MAEFSAIKFLNEVKAELNRVVWPSRQETIKLTAIVVGVSIATAAYIGLLDYGFTKFIDLLLKR
jgi:preprotein translocase subunit SecE